MFVRTFVIPFYYGSGTIINYGSGSNFLTSYSSGSGSTRQKVTVPMVPVPQHWNRYSWSVRARCVPAAVCVVRLDVARIDESPG